MKRRTLWLVLPLLAVGAVLPFGCVSTYPRRNPVGEVFPTVTGEALDGTEVTLPDVGAGAPMLLLVGYKQNSQFDLDRWLVPLLDQQVDVRVYEVPTIPGLIPGMVAGSIDSGMRRGIPEEDWAAVVTVYGDGEQITRFLGNENPMPGRIVLLDAEGRVVWFHDRGFSGRKFQELRTVLSGLR